MYIHYLQHYLIVFRIGMLHIGPPTLISFFFPDIIELDENQETSY